MASILTKKNIFLFGTQHIHLHISNVHCARPHTEENNYYAKPFPLNEGL